MEPSTTQPRGDDRPSARMSAKRAGKQPGRKQPAGVGKSRISPRKRKLRNLSNQAPEDEVEAAIQSPERSPSPQLVVGPAPAEMSHPVTSDIFPPWDRERAARFRATVSEVTDEEFSVNGFVRALGSEAVPEPAVPNHQPNHAGPSPQAAAPQVVPRPSIEVKSDTQQASPIPLVSSVPPETRHVVEERPTENKSPLHTAPPPAGQPRVEFTYCVVCRHPELQSRFWKPEGSFRSKTLSRLEEELPIRLDWSQFQYLHFQLTAPNTRAEHLVRHGSEDQFDFMKRQLAVIIRDCIAKTPRDKTILVGIVIEPLSDENALKKKSAENEDMDFDW